MLNLTNIAEQARITWIFYCGVAMPKLYEYLGLIILFYANEHEPVHVHGKYQAMESKAEIIIKNGVIVDIVFSTVRGKMPLDGAVLKNFKKAVAYCQEDIVRKWIDFFVYNKPVSPVNLDEVIK